MFGVGMKTSVFGFKSIYLKSALKRHWKRHGIEAGHDLGQDLLLACAEGAVAAISSSLWRGGSGTGLTTCGRSTPSWYFSGFRDAKWYSIFTGMLVIPRLGSQLGAARTVH